VAIPIRQAHLVAHNYHPRKDGFLAPRSLDGKPVDTVLHISLAELEDGEGFVKERQELTDP
jgi:hypothetical protein